MSSCPTPGKRGYRSRQATETARRAFGGRVRAYVCVCGLWHVTTTKRGGGKHG